MFSLSECRALAKDLNTQYHDPAVYDPSVHANLTEYLQETGVLLSVCEEGPECTPLVASAPEEDHKGYHTRGARTHAIPQHSRPWTFSGSWIQESTTGPRIFGNFTGGVGMILNPAALNVACLYPLDAATVGRSQQRCGPPNDGGPGGDVLPWWTRAEIKLYLNWLKWTKFPHTAWKDIPCSELLPNDDDDDEDDDDSITPWSYQPILVDHNETWKTLESYYEWRVIASVFSHEICYDDSRPVFRDELMLLYMGPDPWTPDQWNENAAVTRDIVAEHPTSKGIWNEIVFDYRQGPETATEKPAYADAVQAIFYFNGDRRGNPFRHRAHKEAKRLGNKPVLEFLPGRGNVFQCSWPLLDDQVDVASALN